MDQENKKTHGTKKDSATAKKDNVAVKKEPAAPEKKEPEKNNIQELIDKAKAKGSLTNTEILAALGDADYDIDQSYWSFYLGEDYATVGIYATNIEAGAVYKLVYTVG